MSNLRKLFWTAFIIAVAIALLVIALIRHRPPLDVVADFQGRTSGAAPIAANFLGSGGVGSSLENTAGMKLITDSNLRGNRIWAALDQIYHSGDPSNGTVPNYWTLDRELPLATANGLDPIIELSGTPFGMGSSWCDLPTGANIAKWADMAAAVAAHIAATRPGLRYEIWNEPDSTVTNCVSKDMLNDYLNLYAAAAPKVKDAVKGGGGKVGGPALAAPAGNTATWIPRLLADTRTAPYVDFVSYHTYITGQWDLDNHGGTMDWTYVYNITVDPTRSYQYLYRQLEALVRKGSQPDAAHTPIYLTEYNLNWVFKPNCCQNHAQYGPLWNAVVITEMLNSVNDGASRLPDGLVYFMSASGNNYFCLVGATGVDYVNCTLPSGGDADKVYVEYPSLLTYQLFAQSSDLGIEDGGYVVPRPTVPSQLKAVALYTSTADSVVLINPWSTDYPELHLSLEHLGLQHLHGEVFTLVNNQLIRSDLTLHALADKVAAEVSLPPYSTVAVKISGDSQ